MVDLQDVANVALIVSLGANAWNYVYGPWAKRRELRRETIAKLAGEIRNAKAAASRPTMDAQMGRFENWEEDGRRLPAGIRRELERFVQICESYRNAYLLASKLLKLIIYEAVLNRPTLPRVPKTPPKGYGDPMWLVRATSGPIPTWSLHEAFVTALTEPLLQGQSVRWSWLADHQREFSEQLEVNIGQATVNAVLEEIEKILNFDPRQFDRPREIKAAILEYPLAGFPEMRG